MSLGLSSKAGFVSLLRHPAYDRTAAFSILLAVKRMLVGDIYATYWDRKQSALSGPDRIRVSQRFSLYVDELAGVFGAIGEKGKRRVRRYIGGEADVPVKFWAPLLDYAMKKLGPDHLQKLLRGKDYPT